MTQKKLPVWHEGMPVIRPPYITQAGIAITQSIVQTIDGSTTGLLLTMYSEYEQPVYNIMHWSKEEENMLTALDVEPDTQVVVLAHPEDFILNMLKKYGHEPGLGVPGHYVEITLGQEPEEK